ncbi:hypothetical protein H9P43_002513 [Blastocladiella emersonii ATCC 22665]|nr:hypothetical protein H9P43_002513 [Blastocladiella emersonii ATCC 22665]
MHALDQPRTCRNRTAAPRQLLAHALLLLAAVFAGALPALVLAAPAPHALPRSPANEATLASASSQSVAFLGLAAHEPAIIMPDTDTSSTTTASEVVEIVSDALIAIAYFTIPCMIYYFQRALSSRFPLTWVLWLFDAFIVGCGLTHAVRIVPGHPPALLLALKVITALVSLGTAAVLIRIMPLVLLYPARVARLEQELGRFVRRDHASQFGDAWSDALRHLVAMLHVAVTSGAGSSDAAAAAAGTLVRAGAAKSHDDHPTGGSDDRPSATTVTLHAIFDTAAAELLKCFPRYSSVLVFVPRTLAPHSGLTSVSAATQLLCVAEAHHAAGSSAAASSPPATNSDFTSPAAARSHLASSYHHEHRGHAHQHRRFAATTIDLAEHTVGSILNQGSAVKLSTVDLTRLLGGARFSSAVAMRLAVGNDVGFVMLCAEDESALHMSVAEVALQHDAVVQVQLALDLATSAAHRARLESQVRDLRRDVSSAAREVDAARNHVKEVSAFVAVTSHELRTPMNAIIGFVDVLLEDTSLTADMREALETVLMSANLLMNLVNNILDLAKLEHQGSLTLSASPFSVRGCIESCIDLIAQRIEHLDVALNYIVAPDVPDAVVGDRTRITQVLANLMSNSAKFTEHGEIYVVVSRNPVVFPNAAAYRYHRCLDFTPGARAAAAAAAAAAADAAGSDGSDEDEAAGGGPRPIPRSVSSSFSPFHAATASSSKPVLLPPANRRHVSSSTAVPRTIREADDATTPLLDSSTSASSLATLTAGAGADARLPGKDLAGQPTPVQRRRSVSMFPAFPVPFHGSGTRTTSPPLASLSSNPAPLPDGAYLYFYVADTGSGIGDAAMHRLFERFAQGADTAAALGDLPSPAVAAPAAAGLHAAQRAHGTGLGLSISAKLVELHHGRIWVQSAPGVGSIFGFALPIDAAGSPPRIGGAAPVPTAASPSVGGGAGQRAAAVPLAPPRPAVSVNLDEVSGLLRPIDTAAAAARADVAGNTPPATALLMQPTPTPSAPLDVLVVAPAGNATRHALTSMVHHYGAACWPHTSARDALRTAHRLALMSPSSGTSSAGPRRMVFLMYDVMGPFRPTPTAPQGGSHTAAGGPATPLRITHGVKCKSARSMAADLRVLRDVAPVVLVVPRGTVATTAARAPKPYNPDTPIADLLVRKPIKAAALHRALDRAGALVEAGWPPAAVVEVARSEAVATPGDQDDAGVNFLLLLNIGHRMPLDDNNNQSVLIVDDDPINRKVAMRLMASAGVRGTVATASNGREALDRLKAEPDQFQVVFMDVSMPVLGGLEATQELRRRELDSLAGSSEPNGHAAASAASPLLLRPPPGRFAGDSDDDDDASPSPPPSSPPQPLGRPHQWVCAMTASALPEERDACLQAGMDDFISKPIKKDAVAAAMQRALAARNRRGGGSAVALAASAAENG